MVSPMNGRQREDEGEDEGEDEPLFYYTERGNCLPLQLPSPGHGHRLLVMAKSPQCCCEQAGVGDGGRKGARRGEASPDVGTAIDV
jgi:hypothetical protein